MKIEIKNRWSGEVIFAHEEENNSMKLTVISALDASISLISADLSGANLSGADLIGANLSYADLSRANLSGANLSGANLSRANLSRANLSGADLSGADLSRAYLSGADLSGADLSSANLSGADLISADLSWANLSGADLTPIRDDIWSVLSAAPAEVPALIAALKAGKVDGSTYSGECCCLVGTIANARGCGCIGLGDSLKPNPSRPAERFFMGINEGDTPETNQFSALALKWSQEWFNRMQAAFGQK